MRRIFSQLGKEIPSLPELVFCIQVFCTAYQRKRYEIIFSTKTVLSNFSMLVLELELCFHLGKNYVFIPHQIKD